MSYAIVNMIYSVPLMDTNGERSDDVNDFIEEEPDGVLKFYSGSGETPAAFGVNMKCDFDECTHHTELSSIRTLATTEEKATYKNLLADLTPEQQKMLEQFGEPRVFMLWSTS